MVGYFDAIVQKSRKLAKEDMKRALEEYEARLRQIAAERLEQESTAANAERHMASKKDTYRRRGGAAVGTPSDALRPRCCYPLGCRC